MQPACAWASQLRGGEHASRNFVTDSPIIIDRRFVRPLEDSLDPDQEPLLQPFVMPDPQSPIVPGVDNSGVSLLDGLQLPPALQAPAQGDQNPMLAMMDNTGAPPLVGQDRAIDPNDKTGGITGTWDMFGPKKGPRIDGVYMDPPFNAHGDPFTYQPGGGDPAAGGSTSKNPMDAFCGPGKHWQQQGNSGRCAPNQPATPAGPGIPVPAPAPQSPGDYPMPSPDDNRAVA